MTVLAVHRQEPNWPADNGRPRYLVAYGGRDYWAETDGPEPTSDDVARVIETPIEHEKAAHIRKLTNDADACIATRPIHAEKFAQAMALQANPDLPLSDVPLIAASIGFDGQTAADVAEVFVAKFTAAVTHAADVERARLTGEAAIRAASTLNDVRSAYGAVTWPKRA